MSETCHVYIFLVAEKRSQPGCFFILDDGPSYRPESNFAKRCTFTIITERELDFYHLKTGLRYPANYSDVAEVYTNVDA